MTLTRLGGAALLVGGVATAFVTLFGLFTGDSAPPDTTTAVLEAIAGVLLLLGLPALLAGNGPRFRAIAVPGHVALFLLLLGGNVFAMVGALVLPWAAAGGLAIDAPPPAVETFGFGLSLLVPVATGLMAVAVLRAKAYAPAVGWLFALSAVSFVLEFVPVPAIWASSACSPRPQRSRSPGSSSAAGRWRRTSPRNMAGGAPRAPPVRGKGRAHQGAPSGRWSPHLLPATRRGPRASRRRRHADRLPARRCRSRPAAQAGPRPAEGVA